MPPLLQDAKFGLHILWRSRGVTLAALAALALGIGANTAIFSLVDAVLLRPLPYPDSDRLVLLWENNLGRNLPELMVSTPNFLDFARRNRSFERLSGFEPTSFALTGRGDPERIRSARVSEDLFATLGVEPRSGRRFLASEASPGGEPVLIVSHGFWQRRTGSDPRLLGSTLTLDGRGHTVIGIMPPGFEFPDRNTELWLPLVSSAREVAQRGYHHLGVVGRLRSGVDRGRAQHELNAIAAQLGDEYPVTNRGWGVRLVPIREHQFGEVRPALLVLLGAVGFVLLIACTNVANLMLARNAGRGAEVAIRIALGAGRGRLVRQFLTESVLLSLAGGGLGLALAPLLTRLLLALRPESLPLLPEVRIHAGVLWFTLAVSIATGLLFGVIPALEGARTDLNTALREGGRSAMRARRGRRARGWLVIAEVAISLVLLVAAMLMLRTSQHLHAVSPGFRADHLLTLRLTLPDSKYAGDADKSAFYRDLIERVQSLPGIESAAGTNCLPMVSDFGQIFLIEGRPVPSPGEAPVTGFRSVTPAYFRAMRIPLLAGRSFTSSDTAESPPVVIVNETLARRYWPSYPAGESPIGRRIRFGLGSGPGAPWRTIAGIAGDVRHHGLSAQLGPEVYVPYAQMPQAGTTLVVRTLAEPASMAAAVRAEIHSIDRDQPVGETRTMEAVVAESIAPRNALTVLLLVFGLLALLLSAVGIYGVVRWSVAERTNEIGVRVALGAPRGRILRMLVGQAVLLALAGVLIGALASAVLMRVLSSLLYNVSVTDPATFAAVSVLLVGVAVLAGYLPARKATRVDPASALRVS